MSTYYVDSAVGNDANAGTAEGSGNAWATIDKAMNTVVAGDLVYVKASGIYTENPAIDTAGTLGSPIMFEAYTSTPGDNGQCSVTGEISDTITGRLYYIFKNFDINNAGGAGAGKCVDLAGTETVWKNCIFRDNTAIGLVDVGNHAAFEKCEFNDGTGDGCICDSAVFVGCKFYRNQLNGIDCGSHLICFACEFFSNGSLAIDGGAANETFVVAINCTIDGDGKDTTHGVFKNTVIHGLVAMVNNIIYDCDTGSQWGAGGTANAEFGISLNNLLNSNTNNYLGGAFTSEGEQTGAPTFTNEAGNDYTLGSASPAKTSGYDLAGFMDMGASQTDPTSAGGGGNTIKSGGQL